MRWAGPWGSDEAETSPLESDEAVVVFLTVGRGNVTLFNLLAQIPGYRYLTIIDQIVTSSKSFSRDLYKQDVYRGTYLHKTL